MTDHLDPAHLAALWESLAEAAETSEHDALCGLLLVSGLVEQCGSTGVDDATECGFVHWVSAFRAELTPLGWALVAWRCAAEAERTEDELRKLFASFTAAERSVDWGHWGITFHAGPMQPGGYRKHSLGKLHFAVGVQGPCDGTLGSPEHERYKRICRDWKERGVLPPKLEPPANWQAPVNRALWAHAMAEVSCGA